MTVTITSSAGGTTTPTLVLSYSWSRRGGNARHDIIGGAFPDFTLRPAGARAGRLTLVYPDRGDAIAAEALHAAAATFTLTDTDVPEAGMVYAVDQDGAIDLRLDETTLRTWLLTVAFAQVG